MSIFVRTVVTWLTIYLNFLLVLTRTTQRPAAAWRPLPF